MEIRISLDTVEPPTGRLWRLPGPGPAPRPAAVSFTGWLGLLRALYEVAGRPQPPDGGGPQGAA
jgi:hypothetical protein